MAAVGGVQRFVTLPPAPESARQARRFVAEVLTAAGAAEFIDSATLLTSELVTNGIVHAHTELQVVAEATARWVRVEVIDGSPQLPARRSYADDAQTGRGLEMVELLADDFGMETLDGQGKRVWFRLGAQPVGAQQTSGDLGADDVFTDEPSTVITLPDLPVLLYLAWQEHAEAILREATLTALERYSDLPEELAMASQSLAALAAGVGGALGDDRSERRTVQVAVPRRLVPAFPVLRDVLRRCSLMSARGELLVQPSLPELQAVRRWVCDEIGRQGQGLPPRPWSDPVLDEAPLESVSAAAVAAVRASALAEVAADRWNRIVAVSEAAAAVLGWDARELEGRRLVTIIPPALRDAHVAAFTRQMLGAQPRILSRPVDVPALRRDGTEVAVQMLIERRADDQGRPLFVATLTPHTPD
jgi:PAS domain S-box-containing protein